LYEMLFTMFRSLYYVAMLHVTAQSIKSSNNTAKQAQKLS